MKNIAIIFVSSNTQIFEPYYDRLEFLKKEKKIIKVFFPNEAINAIYDNRPCVVITAACFPHENNEMKTDPTLRLAKKFKNDDKVKIILTDNDFWEIEEGIFDWSISMNKKNSMELTIKKIDQFILELCQKSEHEKNEG